MKTTLMSQPAHGPRHRLGWIALSTLGVIAAASFLLFNTQEAVSAQPEIPPGYELSSWQQNGQGGKYLLQVADGPLPAAGSSVSGVVTSDTNCMPDAEGLSSCINDIRLADGSTLTVVDNHNMGVNRCLQPSEIVSISTLDDSWVVALTSDATTSK
jgi:hypothetical protein